MLKFVLKLLLRIIRSKSQLVALL